MKKLAAFIDESGDPRFNEGASSHLYYASIIIESDYQEELIDSLKTIQRHFHLNEFKSSAIQSEKRRIRILDSLKDLKIKFLSLSIDKSKVRGEWRKNPRVFYKYTQKILHKKLHSLYDDINITLDKFGSPAYQNSFKKYLESELQLELFDTSLQIGSAKENILIQLADFFAGTKRKLDLDEFLEKETITEKLASFHLFNFSWPKDFLSLTVDEIKNEDDKIIAANAIFSAERFIESYKDSSNERSKVITLEYLLFSVIHVNPNEYTYTSEIIDWLKENNMNYSEEEFRSQIIGQLRERNVVIIGSRKGLKIPVSMSELVEYLSFTTSKYLTIIKRTKMTIDSVKASSLGKIDLLKNESFKLHKDIFELLDKAKLI